MPDPRTTLLLVSLHFADFAAQHKVRRLRLIMTSTNGASGPDTNPVILDVTYEDAHFTAYVGVSEPDIERAAQWVHAEQFETGEVHVAALDSVVPVSEALADLLFNLNPDDTLVLLCDTPQTQAEALRELGYQADA